MTDSFELLRQIAQNPEDDEVIDRAPAEPMPQPPLRQIIRVHIQPPPAPRGSGLTAFFISFAITVLVVSALIGLATP
jgi:hypothetical protein